MKRVLCGIIIICLLTTVVGGVFADELDDINTELSKLKSSLDVSRNATKPLEIDLNKINQQLVSIKNRLTTIETSISVKEKQIKTAERAFVAQKHILDKRIKSHYKNIKKVQNSFLNLLVTDNAATSIQGYFYQKKAADNDKQIILRIVAHIELVEEQKDQLDNEKTKLSATKKTVDEQWKFLNNEVVKAKQYQTELSSKIAQLSAQQQQLIARKLASLNLPTSLGAGPLFCTDDRKLDPGFGQAFAFFTYGIPHRVGMNQYGALGRSKAGQNYKDILNAYFDGVTFEKKDPHMKIKVQGFGEIDLDQYLLGIYEMPGSWPIEALKAQVVAARSYALSYTNNGQKEICTTQSCQVYKGGNKGGDWERAVHDTEGEVLTRDGQVITAWYASTAGGYTYTSSDVGWGTRPWTKRMSDSPANYSNFTDLNNSAYDKESPCFYAAQGSRAEFNKSAWLKPQEVADIVNTILLAKADSSTQPHLSQLDKPNPDGTDTWDIERVKQELKNRGISPYSSISSVLVGADFGIGKTTSVNFSGDGGSTSFDGGEFKNYFNLRAPANLQIVGPLFNAERK
ncbi:hypothetical protein A2690_00315 [Candidatus Roizmanbacteria bacterium RIFCSPHIGHO2_01_FULL_39_12b]|uniref:Sporulation stage II protein D amidase enhancer LytB N-terminal domain-containing protein n=1 Tax=Candidatus Roizmanbacteria bacterium RIFCSPHIGHO2_01_FULL_39_12b TaxID=1802030 RepID=A0A1F7G8G3_9BACT|nr:MAG: hypothetical protein A2690_00315 [Candidatus Roizmanbacteria bacterium RIFCSPHIGHO2_01_FULL_39_12b]OGK46010.1 MAG: hypothetical protein A3B46_00605 [Candidatus Roizmanbacteria bacterium RIFCSPLOWO2_01_FULL_39_19]